MINGEIGKGFFSKQLNGGNHTLYNVCMFNVGDAMYAAANYMYKIRWPHMMFVGAIYRKDFQA